MTHLGPTPVFPLQGQGGGGIGGGVPVSSTPTKGGEVPPAWPIAVAPRPHSHRSVDAAVQLLL